MVKHIPVGTHTMKRQTVLLIVDEDFTLNVKAISLWSVGIMTQVSIDRSALFMLVYKEENISTRTGAYAYNDQEQIQIIMCAIKFLNEPCIWKFESFYHIVFMPSNVFVCLVSIHVHTDNAFTINKMILGPNIIRKCTLILSLLR